MKSRLFVVKEIEINSTADKVFPLLCPVREYEWIPKWECEIITSKSGFNEKGCIFKTKNSYGAESMIWTTQEYDAFTYTVRFTNFTSSGFVVNFRINLFDLKTEGKCKAVFNYEFIPVSEEGVAAVASIETETVETVVGNLEKLLNKHFEK